MNHFILRYLAEDIGAAARMAQLQTQYSARMDVLGFSAARKQSLLERIYFANISATSDTTSFMQGVLNQWVSPCNVLTANFAGAPQYQSQLHMRCDDEMSDAEMTMQQRGPASMDTTHGVAGPIPATRVNICFVSHH